MYPGISLTDHFLVHLPHHISNICTLPLDLYPGISLTFHFLVRLPHAGYVQFVGMQVTWYYMWCYLFFNSSLWFCMSPSFFPTPPHSKKFAIWHCSCITAKTTQLNNQVVTPVSGLLCTIYEELSNILPSITPLAISSGSTKKQRVLVCSSFFSYGNVRGMMVVNEPDNSKQMLLASKQVSVLALLM